MEPHIGRAGAVSRSGTTHFYSRKFAKIFDKQKFKNIFVSLTLFAKRYVIIFLISITETIKNLGWFGNEYHYSPHYRFD
jgi:hypothetical protein